MVGCDATEPVTSVPRYMELRVECWSDLRLLLGKFRRSAWVFRGQANARWPLATTFERCVPYPPGSVAAYEIEQGVLKKFYERAHHYGASPLGSYEENTLEWAAHLRHHGGPCRLLDVTHSPHVAAFFALENSPGTSAIWAIQTNLLWLERHRLHDAMQIPVDQWKDYVIYAFAKAVAAKWDLLLVAEGRASRINERMAAQQGTFLIPFNVAASFEKNLFGTFGLDADETMRCTTPRDYAAEMPRPPEWKDLAIIKIVMGPEVPEEGLEELALMNITAASLFPGLDGFGRSLASRLRRDSNDEFRALPDWADAQDRRSLRPFRLTPDSKHDE